MIELSLSFRFRIRLHRKKSMLDSKSHKVTVRPHLLHPLILFSRGKSENHHEQNAGKEKRLEDGRNRGRIHVSVSAGKIHGVDVRNELREGLGGVEKGRRNISPKFH